MAGEETKHWGHQKWMIKNWHFTFVTSLNCQVFILFLQCLILSFCLLKIKLFLKKKSFKQQTNQLIKGLFAVFGFFLVKIHLTSPIYQICLWPDSYNFTAHVKAKFLLLFVDQKLEIWSKMIFRRIFSPASLSRFGRVVRMESSHSSSTPPKIRSQEEISAWVKKELDKGVRNAF